MEVLPPVAAPAAAVDDGKLHSDIMLFKRWTYDDVQVPDLSVEDYITATSSKHPIYMRHTAGRMELLPPVAPAAAVDDGKLHSDIILFSRWTYDEVLVSDLSVEDYIAIITGTASKHPPTAGRYQARRFRKAQFPIVERLTNSLMMHGRNNGKKWNGRRRR